MTAAPIPPFTEELEEFRQVVRRFVANELAPHAAEWEEARWFPNEVFTTLAAQGYLGLKYPAEYGGSDGGYLADAVLTEELARCKSGGTAAGIGAQIGIATPPVWKFGTEEQKRRYLAPAIRGEKIAALGITEPGAGSDVAGLRTSARRVGGGWVVNGEKTYITNGVRADFIVTAVRTTEEGGHHGISFLIVDRGDGVTSSKLEKLGWHASDTATIAFEDVFVPEENLLGRENEGFYLIMANFQWERLLMALGAVGSMQATLDRVVELLTDGNGSAPSADRLVRHQVAELAVRLETGRAITYEALRLFSEGHNAIREVTIAKLKTQRDAFDVADAALQLHHGAGYPPRVLEGIAELERAVRDLRLGPIGGGTDEVMKEILTKQIGL